MAETSRTRRQIVKNSPYPRWIAKPFPDVPNTEIDIQEVVVLSKDELLHALYDCDPDTSTGQDTPAGDLYEVIDANTLNVRETPDTSRPPVGQLKLGNRVYAVMHNNNWLKITQGTYKNKYIAKRYTRLVNPL